MTCRITACGIVGLSRVAAARRISGVRIYTKSRVSGEVKKHATPPYIRSTGGRHADTGVGQKFQAHAAEIIQTFLKHSILGGAATAAARVPEADTVRVFARLKNSALATTLGGTATCSVRNPSPGGRERGVEGSRIL